MNLSISTTPLFHYTLPSELVPGAVVNYHIQYGFKAIKWTGIVSSFADNKLEPYADPLTFSAGSLSGSIAESAKFFITPEGTIVVVRINKESSLPEFCVLDENRQWTEWQTANDVKQYSGFDGAMAPDGTILCAYTSRDEAKVSRIESFTIGMEPDILPE